MTENFLPDHTPAVYWFWHTVPTDTEIVRQIAEMQQAGIQTFLIQPRTAFPLEEYLGESYLKAYLFAVEEAQRVGMTVGIYDDYNWDSGQAGGRTVQRDPQARERQLFWTQGEIVDGSSTLQISEIENALYGGMGEGIFNWIYEGGEIVWDDWQIFKVLAYPQKEGAWYWGEVIDVSAYARVQKMGPTTCEVRVEAPPELALEGCQVFAFVHGQCVSSRLINYLSPQAVEAFIQAGYEPYREWVGQYFGDPIQYIFFDHPYAGFYTWQEQSGEIGNSLMFDAALPETFLAQKGYPLEQALLHFFRPKQQATPVYRCDFFEVYGALGRETFFGRVKQWAQENNLALTGHELLGHVGAWGWMEGFSSLDPRTNFSADYFAIDRYRDYTAVDASNYHPQVSAKVGDSVAKANGRRGCIIEQYSGAEVPGVPFGAGQWGLTLSELRGQAIRHTLFGARQYLFHGFYQTDGTDENDEMYLNPRFDFAPGINFEPWFTHFPDLAKELAWLSEQIYASESAVKVAVYFPLETWWAEDCGHLFSKESGKWFQTLLANGCDFDLIDAAQLEKAIVEGGQLRIGLESYTGLVFPGVTTLRSITSYQKVKTFVQQGGTFIASGTLPDALQSTGGDGELNRAFVQLVASSEKAHFLQPRAADAKDAVLPELADLYPIRVADTQYQHIWTWQGMREDLPALIYFHDNDHSNRLSMQIGQANIVPYRLELDTGEAHFWPWYHIVNNEMTVFWDANPQEIGMFVFRSGSVEQPHVLHCTEEIQIQNAMSSVQTGIQGEIGKSGQHEITVCAWQQPEIHTAACVQSALKQIAPGIWQIRFEVGCFPEAQMIKDWTFSTAEEPEQTPIDIQRGWEQQGYSDFAGEGIYVSTFDFEKSQEGFLPTLVLPRVETAAEVTINGMGLGRRSYLPYQWTLTDDVLKRANNHLEIRVRNTGANYYYAGTTFQPEGKQASGLIGCPEIEFRLPFEIVFPKD